MLRIGTPAPEFEILLHSKLRFRLSDYHGRNSLVISFQPWDRKHETPREVQVFAEHMQDITSRNAILLCISDVPAWNPSLAGLDADAPILFAGDPNHHVCRNYRVLWLGGKAIRRVTYVIDKKGIIRGVAHHALLIDRHWTTVRRVLEKLHQEDEIAAYNRRSLDL